MNEEKGKRKTYRKRGKVSQGVRVYRRMRGNRCMNSRIMSEIKESTSINSYILYVISPQKWKKSVGVKILGEVVIRNKGMENGVGKFGVSSTKKNGEKFTDLWL